MASAIGFNTSISVQFIPTKGTSNHFICNIPLRKSSPVQPLKPTRRKPYDLFVVPTSSPTSDTSSLSPAARTIMEFYSSINQKNLTKLEALIADDCCFRDYFFAKPFQGKKEVMHFLEQLTTCMGDHRNMRFNVELVCEGNDYTVAFNWHLDWKKMEVPFTRGSSCFSLLVNDDKLLIKKAQVLIESPIKLGVVALAIFKSVTSIFDAFPAATEWFLKSPHTMFRVLIKAYSIGIHPVISPFLAWYINLTACILTTTLNILHYIAKIFHK
ncbi:uncharacterized protein LOC121754971 isoform X1 [Salvia splendens]|uniref:uncharacterized protein LOC121754971 isoform X1 n=1 Tax=Salvia splendens TaxID=180675 RepID=UPI001C262927|nr:uncharacterized protein LOC121754971 isoform X1 [Salvia splendens]